MSKTVLYPEQMRELERWIMEQQRVEGRILMETAGLAVAQAVMERVPEGGRVLIVCGSGNNGGDGYVAARHLAMAGRVPVVWCVASLAEVRGDARSAREAMEQSGICPVCLVEEEELPEARSALGQISAVVDGLLGIGFSRAPEGLFRALIGLVNELDAPVYAVDLPSGVDGSTGRCPGAAVQADVTVTFQCVKPGHLLEPGRAKCGEVRIAPISLCRDYQPPEGVVFSRWLQSDDLFSLLPKRPEDCHKGDFGRALLIAGSEGFSGAAILCARSALRAGTGLLTVALPRGIAPALWSALPEAMSVALEQEERGISPQAAPVIEELLRSRDCAAFGPGVGRGEGAKEALLALLQSGLPAVIDADGLTILSKDAEAQSLLRETHILTPHPGEMARLCGRSTADIVAAPVSAARALSKKWGCIVLLKGTTSVIAAPDGRTAFQTIGTSGLAKGGSGDVLTGAILAMLAQGLMPFEAACCGALLLGLSACAWEKQGHAPESLLAGDAAENFRFVLDRTHNSVKKSLQFVF